ncbi:MAG: VWA domain-containing protein [Candidatus Methanomethylicaceae archaeon]
MQNSSLLPEKTFSEEISKARPLPPPLKLQSGENFGVDLVNMHLYIPPDWAEMKEEHLRALILHELKHASADGYPFTHKKHLSFLAYLIKIYPLDRASILSALNVAYDIAVDKLVAKKYDIKSLQEFWLKKYPITPEAEGTPYHLLNILYKRLFKVRIPPTKYEQLVTRNPEFKTLLSAVSREFTDDYQILSIASTIIKLSNFKNPQGDGGGQRGGGGTSGPSGTPSPGSPGSSGSSENMENSGNAENSGPSGRGKRGESEDEDEDEDKDKDKSKGKDLDDNIKGDGGSGSDRGSASGSDWSGNGSGSGSGDEEVGSGKGRAGSTNGSARGSAYSDEGRDLGGKRGTTPPMDVKVDTNSILEDAIEIACLEQLNDEQMKRFLGEDVEAVFERVAKRIMWRGLAAYRGVGSTYAIQEPASRRFKPWHRTVRAGTLIKDPRNWESPTLVPTLMTKQEGGESGCDSIVTVIDTSGSMGELYGQKSKLRWAKEAAIGLVAFAKEHSLPIKVIRFANAASQLTRSSRDYINHAKSILRLYPEGGTNPSKIISLIRKECSNTLIVMITDGEFEPNELKEIADSSKDKKVVCALVRNKPSGVFSIRRENLEIFEVRPSGLSVVIERASRWV